MAARYLDRNANTDARQRRALQQLYSGAGTSAVAVTSPLTNSGGSVSLSLGTSGGLVTSSGTLGIKLLATNPGLQLASGGMSVLLATASGLSLSSGLKINALGVTTAMLAANAVTVAKMQLATNPGLEDSTGLRVKLDGGGALSRGANGLAAAVDGTTITISANKLTATAYSPPVTTKGDVFTYSTVPARLGVGTNTQMLVADSTAATGLKWADQPAAFTSPLTTKGDIYAFSTVDARLGVGSDGQVLGAKASETTGLKWLSLGTASLLDSGTGAGNVPLNSDLGTAAYLDTGIADGDVVVVQTGGKLPVLDGSNLTNVSATATLPITTKGDLVVYTTAAARLGVGSDGQVLQADSTQTPGLKWGSLGTASAKDTGTSSGQIPILGANGLPAVSGQDLTGVQKPIKRVVISTFFSTGNDGGVYSTAGAWQTLACGTFLVNDLGRATDGTGFNMSAGTYRVTIWASPWNLGKGAVRLNDTTNSTILMTAPFYAPSGVQSLVRYTQVIAQSNSSYILLQIIGDTTAVDGKTLGAGNPYAGGYFWGVMYESV